MGGNDDKTGAHVYSFYIGMYFWLDWLTIK